MAPLFSIMLLYFVLFLYGEFSEYLEVRYTSRILFYGFSANLSLLHYFPDNGYAGLLSCIILLATFLYITITTSLKWFSRVMFIPLLVLLVNYVVVYVQPQDLIEVLPQWYLLYSDKIYREGFLLILGVLSFLHGKKDEKLNYTVMILYALEYTVTMEI